MNSLTPSLRTNLTGKVEFFNNVAGWGKIVADKTGEAFFVHHRDIKDSSFFPSDSIKKFRTLSAGQPVMFDGSKTEEPMDAALDVIFLGAKDDS